MEKEYVVAPQNTFNEPLSDSQLNYISNAELLRFELEPKMKAKIDRIKSDVFKDANKLIMVVDDIDEVVNYMLSSISESLKQNQQESDAIQNIRDGFQRAINKVGEIDAFLDDLLSKVDIALYNISADLNKELQILKENENVSNLKLRINKAKAIGKSLDILNSIKIKFNNYFEIFASGFQKFKQQYYHYKELIVKRFFAATIPSEAAREVSDFLNETDAILGTLPVMYRRLYSVDALNDTVLFEGRELELQLFKKAYTAWTDGKYASLLICGERGSGISSLINIGVKQNKIGLKVHNLLIRESNENFEHLLSLFADLLGEQNFEDKTALIKYLNEGSKKLIIVEKIHQLYLRVIGGDKCLYELFDIIMATQKNIFWVVSISVYAYEYLEKTMRMSGFFSYINTLQPLSDTAMSNLIIKRNRISGFKILFEESAEISNKKEFKKLDEEAKQEYLKKRFFKDLNSFARSNISMALIFWLLSTKSVSEDTIIIKSFKKPDLSFISSLAMERVFVLHALVLHEGLTKEQLSSVLSISIQKAYFLLIESLEDGLLRQEGEVYKINPMVYRSSIQLLKSKNLISL